jgi:tetratricopeptide (TPR) repeat protein
VEAELGRSDAAAAAFGRAIELLDALLVERADDRGLRRRLMELHRIRAQALEQEGEPARALVHCRRHLDLGRALPSPTFEDQAHLAEVGLAVGRLETTLAEAAEEPERRRRLEMARYQLRHALDQADELSRMGPIEVAESDLLGRLQSQLAEVEDRLSTYPSSR